MLFCQVSDLGEFGLTLIYTFADCLWQTQYRQHHNEKQDWGGNQALVEYFADFQPISDNHLQQLI